MNAEVEAIIRRIVTRAIESPATPDPALYARLYARVAGTGNFLEAWLKPIADDLFIAAAEAVSAAGYGSNALIRSKLEVGYLRASGLIEALQAEGILGCELDHDARLELIRPIGFY
jgi:DNA segregation ATPase FtsK/SpoIIIE-like protein